MKTRQTIVALMSAGVVLLGANVPAYAQQNTTTSFFASGGVEGEFSALIWVAPAGSDDPLFEGSVKVKLFKRIDGAWVQKAAKQAIPNHDDMPYWYVEFHNGPKAGTCRMVARFSGTEQWDPSTGSSRGKCSDGNWQW